MQLSDFDYRLPPELIAQHPARRRADSRMLVIHRHERRWEDARFRDLPRYLQPGDVLAVNNSRVIPARLLGYRAGVRSMPIGKNHPKRKEYLTARVEALLARQIDERTWEALVRPGRKIRTGERLIFEAPENPQARGRLSADDRLEAEVIGRGEYGVRTLRFEDGASFQKRIRRIGHVPLPPYIHRPEAHPEERSDRLRYQTVYARHSGAVAAPTAGLHFTPRVFDELARRGVERAEITLHVGLGTFQPIHTENIDQHVMHPEHYEVSEKTADELNLALQQRRRIVTVGTTTVRTLEHIASEHAGRIAAETGDTRLFIKPGFAFQITGGLLTNFHLPRTTLLMLVAAFTGRELMLAAYEHAVRERYRFYSYGDCMLIL